MGERLVLDTLEINNFGSYKQRAYFEFKDGIHVFFGPNGAGKSTMIEAIFYVLYGKFARKNIVISDYVSSNSSCEIALEFHRRDIKYRVQVKVSISYTGTQNTDWKLTKHGKGHDKEWVKRKVIDSIIEEEVGNRAAILNSVYSPQGELESLLELSAGKLKNELANIFRIEKYKRLAEIWRVSNKEAREKLRNNNELIKEKDSPCEKVKETQIKLTGLQKKEKELRGEIKILEEERTKIQERVVEKEKLTVELKGKKQQLEKIQKGLDELRGDLDKILKRLGEDFLQEDILERKSMLDLEIRKCGKQIEKIEKLLKIIRPLEEGLKRAEGTRETLDKQTKNAISSVNRWIEGWKGSLQKIEIEKDINSQTATLKDALSEILAGEDNKIVQLKELEDIQSKEREHIDNREKALKEFSTFIDGVKGIENPPFNYDNLEELDEGLLKEWMDKLKEKTNDYIKQSNVLKDTKTRNSVEIGYLEQELMKQNNILTKLEDKKSIALCPECGTELTPESREKNRVKTVKRIENIWETLDEIKKKLENVSDELNEIEKYVTQIKKYGLLEENQEETFQRNIRSFKQIREEKTKIMEKAEKIKKLKELLVPDSILSEEISKHVKQMITQAEDRKREIYDIEREIRELPLKLQERKENEEKIKNGRQRMQQEYESFGYQDKTNSEGLEKEKVIIKDKDLEWKKTLRDLDDYEKYDKRRKEESYEKIQLEAEISKKEAKLIDPKFKGIEKQRIDMERELGNRVLQKEEMIKEEEKLTVNMKRYEDDCKKVGEWKKRNKQLTSFSSLANATSLSLEDIFPILLDHKLSRIIDEANDILRKMHTKYDQIAIKFNEAAKNRESNLSITRGGQEGKVHTLSGGEMTGMAFALRVAIAKELSDVGILILDEPTYGLDETRRKLLADALVSQKEIGQLFVITHDKIFTGRTDNVYKIDREGGSSRNMVEELS